MESEYREPTTLEFLAIIRGRPTAPTLYIKVSDAERYHESMEDDEAMTNEEWRAKWLVGE